MTALQNHWVLDLAAAGQLKAVRRMAVLADGSIMGLSWRFVALGALVGDLPGTIVTVLTCGASVLALQADRMGKGG